MVRARRQSGSASLNRPCWRFDRYRLSARGRAGAANGKPDSAERVTEFPQPPAADDVISDRIIFEIGDSRFAIQWTAEIEQLPPAGPVATERTQRPKSDRSPQTRRSLFASRE